MKKLMLIVILLTAATPVPAATPPDRPGIGDYICHVFQGWWVCKPHPGNRP